MKDETGGKGDEFFVTGLEKYLDAKSAVTMFEQEVQRLVNNVVKGHQPEFTELFGKDWSLKDYSDTSQMPEHMYLGQQVAFKGFAVVYFYLTFSRSENGSVVRPTVMLWRERVSILELLWKEVKEPKPEFANLEIRNDKFWLTGVQPIIDQNSCKNALDAVVIEWIELWRTVGGLSKYLAAQGTAA